MQLVLVGHFGAPVVESSILAELASGLERLLAGTAPLEPFYDLRLNPVQLAWFGRIGLTVAPDWVP